MAYNRSRYRKKRDAFIYIADRLGLKESGISNNSDDYQYFYDAFSLSKESQLWQASINDTEIYINPFHKKSIELFVRGRYDMPLIQLESRMNKVHLQKPLSHKDKLKQVRLEGNFDDYFSLRCATENNIVCLQIFSPEIMEHMIKFQLNYDIQIQGSAIMLTGDCKELSEQHIRLLIEHMATLDRLVRATRKVSYIKE